MVALNVADEKEDEGRKVADATYPSGGLGFTRCLRTLFVYGNLWRIEV